MPTSTDWLISVDDHVVERPGTWTDRLPAKYREVGPRVEVINGLDTWVYEDKQVPMTGIGAIVRKPKESWTLSAVNYADIDVSCYDPSQRVEAMDEAGILTQTLFPSFPRFCGQVFAEASNKELALLGVRAWNDYMIDEWADAYPGRFIPLAIVPLWDGQLAAAEAQRAIARGARGVIFSEQIADLGLPSIHDKGRFWDPLFAVMNETGLPICMHIGSSSKLPLTALDAPSVLTIAIAPMNAFKTAFDWTFSGNFFRFPNLKVVLSEGGIGWIPYVLWQMDHVADTQLWAHHSDFNFDMTAGDYEQRPISETIISDVIPPSQVFKDHVYGCFIDDPVGVRNLDLVGTDNVMIETDYPHSDGSWPNSIKLAREQLEPHGEETMRKILSGNAERVFQFTPAVPSVLPIRASG
jgi:predicted TIM-barrel fold metal-dependent hydrolase